MLIHLFVVDGQNDFLATGKEPWNREGRVGSLLVEGAGAEADILGQMIKSGKKKSGHIINRITPSFDSHPPKHIGNCAAWKGSNGQSPPPFTFIEPEDVIAQTWVPRWTAPPDLVDNTGRHVNALQYAIYYTRALRERGRNKLCTWPTHCQIGTWGQNAYQSLQEAYDDWCEATNGWINYLTKGAFPFTEHYSALQADVPYPGRADTGMNVDLCGDIAKADLNVWAGWAGSHCTKWTAFDFVNSFKEDPVGSGSNPIVRKMIILTDCCAAVGDPPPPAPPKLFTTARAEFLADMEKRGARLMTTDQFMSMVA